MAERTNYEILDVDPCATDDEVRAAYRSLIGSVRPARGGRGGAATDLRQVQEAYFTLSHPDRRENYDMSLNVLRLTPPPRPVPELPRRVPELPLESWSPRMRALHDGATPEPARTVRRTTHQNVRRTTRRTTRRTGVRRVTPMAWLALLLGAAMVVTGVTALATSRSGGTAPNGRAAAPTTSARTATPSGPGSPAAVAVPGVPALPFTVAVTGQRSESRPDAVGRVTITFALQLQDPARTPLTFVMHGQVSHSGGIDLRPGAVTYGPYHGTVAGFNGSTVVMHVDAPGPSTLVADLMTNGGTASLSGIVRGSTGTL